MISFGSKGQRVGRHIAIACAGVIITLLFSRVVAFDRPIQSYSFGTAYASLFLVAVTLLLGPINVLRGKPNPVSTYMRRDFGIWAGLFALIHVVLGLQVHMHGNISRYFFYPDVAERLMPRYDIFGLANHTGLIATAVVVTLLLLSSNFALRAIGASRWKSIQRWNYLNYAMLLVHGLAYQVLERRSWVMEALFLATLLVVLVTQYRGYRHCRTRSSARESYDQ